EKETVIPHDATIFFLVDMANLNWNLPLNKKAETKAGIKALDSLLLTGMQIKQVQINAWASPEGEESRNQNLSDNRVKTGEKYFKDAYNKMLNQRARALKVKANSLKQDLDIQTKSMGEDWDGFIADLRASRIADKNTIINVISSHTDKATREQEIRNMTVIYKEIEDEILPSLRRSEIHVDFLEPKRPDEQIAEYALTAPDSLKLNELLYGATLNEDAAQQLTIYRSAIRIYPDDFRAYVNASALLLKEGHLDEAQSMLETANGMKPNYAHILNNMGAVALAKGDFSNAKSLFESASCSEAQENLGIVAIKEGRYNVAVAQLSANACRYNLALAQLLNGDIDQAKATLNCMETKTAESHYLLAVCAARQDNKAEAIDALTKAVAENAALKAQARKDIEFAKWAYETDFQNVLR
ncbi:MAG: tetratricopeptide repeat protein, partial [Bacteroidales bacterium]|nr:tetratricopeptide repeat protein [Bacteroidales bacterium]